MSNIRITELDFDEIKQNLKQFLNAQDEFSDYDFEGSALSVLLDVLAYNTHYNAYLVNMLANEMFLDSALKKESAISIAKNLSYTPRSRKAASITVNIQVNSVSGSPATLTMDRFTTFSALLNNNDTVKFTNLEPITITPVDGNYIFEDVVLYEGTRVTNTFTSVEPGTAEKFVIPNKDIDTTTIRVTVQNSQTDLTIETYTRVEDITTVTGTDPVYFLEQNNQGNYEIFFGDDKIGKMLSVGNIIRIDYITTSGTAANVSKTTNPATIIVSLEGSIQGYTSATITTTIAPTDGENEESLASIKFNAPRSYTAQNRAVNRRDYEAIIKQNIQNVDSVVVWGGEDNDPPVYGKVFISATPTSGSFITTKTKETINEVILGSKKVVTITPEFVDPEYFYVVLNTNVKYDASATNLTANELSVLVKTSIDNYFDDNLKRFNQSFTFSKLSSAIDASDPSIIGNLTTVKIQKRFVPPLTSYTDQRFVFNNILKPETLETTRFVVSQIDQLVPARIKDVEGTATVSETGTFRRNGSLVTITLEKEHGLTVGEQLTLDFSSGIPDGKYDIYSVPTATTIVIETPSSGTVSGTVTVTSNPRGTLVLYDPTTNETLLNNVGFINYLEGIVFIRNLRIYGFPASATDIRLTVGVEENSKDIVVSRNQIILADDSTSSIPINRNTGIVISTTAVTS